MSAALAHSIELLLLGGALGVCGQFLRAIVGVFKLPGRFDVKKRALFAARFATSLFIGFIAGSAAALLAIVANNQPFPGVAEKLCLVAAGYAGTDFIEAIIGSFSSTAPPTSVQMVGGPASARTAQEPTAAVGGDFESSMASRGQANLLVN